MMLTLSSLYIEADIFVNSVDPAETAQNDRIIRIYTVCLLVIDLQLCS